CFKGEECQLFAVPMHSGAKCARVPVEVPKHVAYGYPSPDPLDGKLVFFGNDTNAPGTSAVYFFDPTSNTLARAFGVELPYPFTAAVDPQRRWIYIGTNDKIDAYDPQGHRVSDAFPMSTDYLSSNPAMFHGALSLADGALWDWGTLGYLRRRNLQGQMDPG